MNSKRKEGILKDIRNRGYYDFCYIEYIDKHFYESRNLNLVVALVNEKGKNMLYLAPSIIFSLQQS